MRDTETGSRGLLALMGGAAAIAFAPIGVRLADVSPTASAFWRLALATVVLWPAAAVAEGRSGRARLQLSRPIILAGLFFAADLGVWHLSIAYTSVANATLEANFAPVFVALAGWLWLGQPVTRQFVLAMTMTLAGAVMLIGPHFGASGRALLGDGLGTLTAVFYAGYMLAVKAATRHASALQIASSGTAIAAVAVLPYAAITAERFWPVSASGWAVLAALALVAHCAGQTLVAYGLTRVPATLGSLILLIQPIMAALYAWMLLGEAIGAPQIFGGAVVLAGIWLAQRNKSPTAD